MGGRGASRGERQSGARARLGTALDQHSGLRPGLGVVLNQLTLRGAGATYEILRRNLGRHGHACVMPPRLGALQVTVFRNRKRLLSKAAARGGAAVHARPLERSGSRPCSLRLNDSRLGLGK